ncbi:MAG: PAS domain-containing protein [Taibaiella sp.]|nr:PAS domain-containing protein [Taibaiella sp.]
MNEVLEFLRHLFDTSGFPPRWHCGHWSEFHGWLYIISDLSVWLAYFAIPIVILKYVSRKIKARYTKLYFLFAAFILACGSTHLLDAIMFWYPFYRVSALVKLATGIVSWVTVFSLIRLLPKAFADKTADQLEAEIEYRKEIEQELKIRNQQLTEALEIARLGHWQWDVQTNRVEWSDMTLKMFGLGEESKQMNYEAYLQQMHVEDRQFVHDAIMQAFKNKEFPKFYHRILLPGGQVRIMLSRGDVILDSNGKVAKMIGTVQDITDMKNTQEELLLKTQKLEASNIELQKFASITSHDLREPLRKIITFGSMLERDSDSHLSEKGTLYLGKMTHSSLRMQKLIEDILDFSRLTVDKHAFTKVRLNNVVAQVIMDMEVAIQKSAAKIVTTDLPEIDGNESQLGQLFQNLIGNAIKFNKVGLTPFVEIKAEIVDSTALPQATEGNNSLVRNPEYKNNERYCKIYIHDNGIGFDEAYLDKIFLIFQRLHDKSEYEGTGIGLAICKKVVDLHNGFISAYSNPGEGATFMIILPLVQAPEYEDTGD